MWIEALSAVSDGEDPGVDRRLVDAHLATCGSCRSFATGLGALSAPTLQASPTMPDLSRRVTRLTAIADRARVGGVLRLLTAVVASVIAVSSIRPLVFADDGMGMGPSHMARHYGAFSMAYAVGLLVIAIRPARARTMLPVAFVVALALGTTAIFDAMEGRVTLIAEGRHVPELTSLVLVWLLARPTAGRAAAAPSIESSLRLVETDDTSIRREAG